MRTTLLIIAAIFFLSSCREESIKTEVTEVNGIKLELLFKKDGCNVYRFRDGMRDVYWSNCAGRVDYDYTTRSGKSSSATHHVESLTE